MRYVNITEQKKLKKEALFVVNKFLNKLDISQIKKYNVSNSGIDYIITFGENNKNTAIMVIADNSKSMEMFVNTYTVKTPKNADIIGRMIPGKLYSSQANFLFYLYNDIIYILPMKKFRKWVDENTDIFIPECRKNEYNGIEIRRHGFRISLSHIERLFMQGNLSCSKYKIKDNPNSDTEIDYIQMI